MSSRAPIKDVKLPTLDHLDIKQSQIDAIKSSPEATRSIVDAFLSSFASSLEKKDVQGILNKFQPDGWWRDFLALTWNIRTFYSHANIEKFLKDGCVFEHGFGVGEGGLVLDGGPGKDVALQQPFPDLAWIQFFVKFKVKVGEGIAVIRLVPTPSANDPSGTGLTWKAHAIMTTLLSLNGHPEKLGGLRDTHSNQGMWNTDRAHEADFMDRQPTVLIIGGGQSGLDVAARLKMLGVDALILERNKEVGQQWKDRYEALCLHDPVWYDHMPYLPFPPNWPVYCPAPKLAGWLKSYAEFMELNVWTSSTITDMKYDEGKKEWVVDIERGGGEGKAFGKRTIKSRRVVFALGLASGVPRMPTFKGSDVFKGKIVHSTAHTTARDYIGKKALIIGACTSAHDIAYDFYAHSVPVTVLQRSSTYIMTVKNGWDVTFAGTYQEGGPPTDVADLIANSYPRMLEKELQKRTTTIIKEMDRELLEDLHKSGFQTNDGIDGSGFPQLAWNYAGGYYLDVGTSRLIADKKIGLVSGTGLSHFTEKSAVFEDGREVECDIVVCATGFGDGRAPIQKLIGPELGNRLQPIWGLDAEGEMRSLWCGTGVENLWIMLGNLALCRYHSIQIALQIKALEEGLWDGKRYEA